MDRVEEQLNQAEDMTSSFFNGGRRSWLPWPSLGGGRRRHRLAVLVAALLAVVSVGLVSPQPASAQEFEYEVGEGSPLMVIAGGTGCRFTDAPSSGSDILDPSHPTVTREYLYQCYHPGHDRYYRTYLRIHYTEWQGRVYVAYLAELNFWDCPSPDSCRWMIENTATDMVHRSGAPILSPGGRVVPADGSDPGQWSAVTFSKNGELFAGVGFTPRWIR